MARKSPNRMLFRSPLPDEAWLALVPVANASTPQTESIWVNESYEPMVDLREVCPTIHLRDRNRPFMARHRVAEKLHQAQVWLDLHRPGLQIEVMEAYRTPSQARAFLRWAGGRTKWAALAIRALKQIPLAGTSPLATGGTLAVRLRDVTGKPMPMISPAVLAAGWQSASSSIKRHRQLLSEAMAQAGFVNAVATWWHWSYGDRLWAAAASQPEASYGEIKRLLKTY